MGDIVEYKGSQYKITDRAIRTKRNWKFQIVPYYAYAISQINEYGLFLTIEWVTDRDLKPHWSKETKLGELL
jgi:hypothetical protein